MFVTYEPVGHNPTAWEFDPGEVRASMAEMIEKNYGKPFEQWFNDVRTGSIKARRVLLWHLMVRDGHALTLKDAPDFLAKEVTVEQSVSELEALLAQVEKMRLDSDQRDAALAAIGSELEEARTKQLQIQTQAEQRGEQAEVEPPKAV